MNKMFENKIAVVTGAGGTLCSEIAIQLSLEGARVFLVGRGAEKLEKTADKHRQSAGGGTDYFIIALIQICKNPVQHKRRNVLRQFKKTRS